MISEWRPGKDVKTVMAYFNIICRRPSQSTKVVKYLGSESRLLDQEFPQEPGGRNSAALLAEPIYSSILSLFCFLLVSTYLSADCFSFHLFYFSVSILVSMSISFLSLCSCISRFLRCFISFLFPPSVFVYWSIFLLFFSAIHSNFIFLSVSSICFLARSIYLGCFSLADLFVCVF
jgi:hypothetical protein